MNQIKNTLLLLRFPFSLFLMPVFVFAMSQAEAIHWSTSVLAFIILHLFIYPASNGYNSYMDQDEGSIGGLKHPPKPTKKLFYAALCLDLLGLTLSFFISTIFFLCLLAYILASRAYSYKGIRLKKYPYLGFLVVIVFQGGFTFLMTLHAATLLDLKTITDIHVWAMIASSLLLAGVYPLTQIYQYEEDLKNGDITLSYKLGYRGTFIFSTISFLLANLFFWLYFTEKGFINNFYILQLFFIPIAFYFVSWFIKVWNNPCNANYEHTMRMNLIASVCLNVCFITLFIINQVA
ncbi:UbiA family prenyltransferase [Solitalea sp. MAHUQ-68]|uniref:UbiA family prenyltransferase n=1 Tax=Solitalea agri TaxID=2953739 RepID=A0A9X2F2K9_9SPHI|nr:UbiA family prenyltransferase [Solitalea agri]MCO4293552.1 UbiA family prenyltransferase [Solitalea agri]